MTKTPCLFGLFLSRTSWNGPCSMDLLVHRKLFLLCVVVYVQVVVSMISYFHPYLGKIPNLTNIFQMGWNHQLDVCVDYVYIIRFVCCAGFDILDRWVCQDACLVPRNGEMSLNETAASEQGQKSARKAIWRAGPLKNRYFLSTWFFHLDPFGTVDGRIPAPVDIMVALSHYLSGFYTSQVVAPWDFFHLFNRIHWIIVAISPFSASQMPKPEVFFSCTKQNGGMLEVSIVSKIGLTMWRPNLPAIDVDMWLIWIGDLLGWEDFP